MLELVCGTWPLLSMLRQCQAVQLFFGRRRSLVGMSWWECAPRYLEMSVDVVVMCWNEFVTFQPAILQPCDLLHNKFSYWQQWALPLYVQLLTRLIKC